MTIISDRSKLIGFYNSPIGKKIVTGVTGLALSLFVLVHTLGNLTIFAGAKAYNQLAHQIESFGVILYLVEFILLGLFVLHVVVGIRIKLNSLDARPINYQEIKTVGEPSKQTLSSRTMIVTGLILLVFLIWHLVTFKFGTSYTTVINGMEMRNLARLVTDKFHNPIYVVSYSGVMILLGLHLRHGLWSAWQSIGLLNTKISPLVYIMALVGAIAIATSFIVLPLAIYGGFL